MTPKQARFAEEYLMDLNATQAALRAGYSPASAKTLGCKLLKNPKVAAAIEAGMAARSRRTGIEADWVLQRLKEVAQRCLTAEPAKDRKGKPTGEYRFDARGATKALELVGKHLGMFSAKTGAAQPARAGTAKDPREMSDQELAEEIAKLG
jgi:phage terminase small subunit